MVDRPATLPLPVPTTATHRSRMSMGEAAGERAAPAACSISSSEGGRPVMWDEGVSLYTS